MSKVESLKSEEQEFSSATEPTRPGTAQVTKEQGGRECACACVRVHV